MRHKTFRRLFCLALALALLCGAAAADGVFSFRKGITWGTAPAQMLAAEGLSEGGYNRHEGNGYTFFYLKGQNVYYVFRGELLLQTYTVLSADAYAAELERQTALYGVPAGVPAETIGSLWNMLVPNSIMPDALGTLSAWRLSDGTLAALFILDGKTCMAYFNEQRMLNGE